MAIKQPLDRSGANSSPPHLIKNNWGRKIGEAFESAQILRYDIHPEGLDIERVRFVTGGCFLPESKVGHIISVYKGRATLNLETEKNKQFLLEAGVHIYLPPSLDAVLESKEGTEFVHVSSPTASQARGRRFLVRDEKFLSACASELQSLRWILTAQYLSRRIFLYHDQCLLSKSGHPISWFRTTMFDVTGLPINDDGESVFKMSYNSRTEINVCYEVRGLAKVRMAQHPYSKKDQMWDPWFFLDGDSSYHLNEVAGGPEEECIVEEKTGLSQYFRNKHEVQITDGHVSLFCLFDPGVTGVECHRLGEYSDYEQLSKVIGSKSHSIHQREISKYDDMLEQLSLAKSMGQLSAFHKTPIWETYLRGQEEQAAIEREVKDRLVTSGKKREHILSQWMQSY